MLVILFPFHSSILLDLLSLFTIVQEKTSMRRLTLLIGHLNANIWRYLRSCNTRHCSSYVWDGSSVYILYESYVALTVLQHIFEYFYGGKRINNNVSNLIYFCFVFLKLDRGKHCKIRTTEFCSSIIWCLNKFGGLHSKTSLSSHYTF